MSEVLITNNSFYDKDYDKTFVKDDGDYKFVSIHDGLSTIVQMYKDLLREALGDKMNESFKDYALSIIETQTVQEVFKNKIESELSSREVTGKPSHKDIVFQGKTYSLDLRLTSPTDRRIDDCFKIYSICKECLEENKPMYLSLE